mmetsp:Transcript_40919/g.103084  ORF Transcript_40919/g.103084 Transcript_40919/m.103084 type:complete len:200 (+) Transcript_40919:281-880(+)
MPGKSQFDDFAGVDFNGLIARPMMAAMDVHVELTKRTVAFIQKYGFENFSQTGGTVRMLKFKYKRPLPGKRTVPVTVAIPFLLCMPIPALRVENMTLSFIINIEKTLQKTVTESKGIHGSMEIGMSSSSTSVQVMASFSISKTNHNDTQTTRTYSMEVNMNVSRPQILPPGFAKLSELVTNAITEQTKIPPPPEKKQDS